MHRKLLLLPLILTLFAAVAFAQDSAEESDVLPITGDVTYEVRPSDTLETIGALFDVSPNCIADQNDLTIPTTLQIGQELLISVSCPLYGEDPRDEGTGTVRFPREVVTFEDECEGYRVRLNDSLETIGFALDISVVSLQLANDEINPQNIIVNTCLNIPEDAPPYGVYPALTDARAGDGQGGGAEGETYIFQPRDTLDVIAQEFDVSVVSLQLANNITNPKLVQPGTLIVIPANAPAYGLFPAVSYPVAGEIYVVQQGDTLASIAEDFDVSLFALRTANGLLGTQVGLGTALLIPTDVPAFGADGEFDAEALGIGGGAELHVVQPRETLDIIAATYDVNTSCLAENNEIASPPLLQPGTVLLVDSNCGPYVGEGIPPVNNSITPVEETDEEEDTEAQPLGG